MPEEKPAPKSRKVTKRTPPKAAAPAAPLEPAAAPAAPSETAQQPAEAPSVPVKPVPVKPAPRKRQASPTPRAATTPRAAAARPSKRPSAKKAVADTTVPPAQLVAPSPARRAEHGNRNNSRGTCRRSAVIGPDGRVGSAPLGQDRRARGSCGLADRCPRSARARRHARAPALSHCVGRAR